MSSKFDAYEIIGVITPGSILLFGLALLFPDLKALFFAEGFSLGDLGLFLVLSFVAGHLIQAVGNLLEVVVWKGFGGMPTDWLIANPDKLIHESQVERLRQAVKREFDCDLQQLSAADWDTVTSKSGALIRPQPYRAFPQTPFGLGHGLIKGRSSLNVR